MAARAFRLCTRADLAAVRARVEEALAPWAHEWSSTAPAGEWPVAADPLDTATLGTPDDGVEWWRFEGGAGTVWARSADAYGVAAWLFGAVDGGVPPGGLAAEVTRRAFAALLSRIAAAAGAAPHRTLGAPAHLLEPGRGAVQVRIDGRGAALQLVVEPPVARTRAVRRTLEPLASTHAALAAQAVMVEARLGDIEVELGVLRTLAVGDVLRLPRRLDQGVELSVGGQRLPCVGYLAAVDGKVAVEIARH
jgi:flagellar motor switch/type III secretory pathway protein FliN